MDRTEQINVRIGVESLAELLGKNDSDKLDIWRLIPDREERERRLNTYLEGEYLMYDNNPRMSGALKQVNIRVTPSQKDEA